MFTAVDTIEKMRKFPRNVFRVNPFTFRAIFIVVDGLID